MSDVPQGGPVRLKQRTKPLRCSYCHAGYAKDDILCICGGSHVACAMENGECPACGDVLKDPGPSPSYEIVTEMREVKIIRVLPDLPSRCCDCDKLIGKEFTALGLCYDCWSAETDQAFPSPALGWADTLSILVCVSVSLLLIVWGVLKALLP